MDLPARALRLGLALAERALEDGFAPVQALTLDSRLVYTAALVAEQ